MNGRRDLRGLVSGLGAKVRSSTVILRRSALIADFETRLQDRSYAWSADFETRRDAVSLAVFGVTAADANPADPHPDQFEDRSPTARLKMGWDARLEYEAALARWEDWQLVMSQYESAIRQRGPISYFGHIGYDVTDGYACELTCLPHFSRQLYVAAKGLLPNARVTIDGSGRKRAQTVEEWGAALAAEAARFRPSR